MIIHSDVGIMFKVCVLLFGEEKTSDRTKINCIKCLAMIATAQKIIKNHEEWKKHNKTYDFDELPPLTRSAVYKGVKLSNGVSLYIDTFDGWNHHQVHPGYEAPIKTYIKALKYHNLYTDEIELELMPLIFGSKENT